MPEKENEDRLQLKTDDNGAVVLTDDGRPVFVWPDGREEGVDVPGMYEKIKSLGRENQKYREEGKGLKEKITLFKDIEDLAAWKTEADEALKAVKNKEVVDAEEFEKFKAGLKESYDTREKELEQSYRVKMDELTGALTDKDKSIRNLVVKGAFDRSQYISEKTVLPPDIAFATFGQFFEVEEQSGELKAVARNAKGDKIYSLANPGELASPEEAIAALINDYSYKDRILKGGHGGSGASGNLGSPGGGITPEQVGAMTPDQYSRWRQGKT